jgi:hypothetical protein
MHRSRSLQLLRHAVLALLFLVPSVSQATVTTYTTLAGFQAAAPGAQLLVDFENRNGLQPNPFTENTLTFSSTNSLYVISPANPGTTSPLPPSKMLSASGIEDFTVVMPGASALGFTLLNNAFGPHTVTLTDASNAVVTYQPTQAHNTVGFIGFVSTTPLVKMRWQSVGGQTQNTALDNFYWQSWVTSAATTTWGRLKTLYR